MALDNQEYEPKSAHLTLEEVTRMAREAALTCGRHEPTVIAEGSQQSLVTPVVGLASTHEGRVEQMFWGGFAVAQSVSLGVLEQVFFIAEGWLDTPDHGQLPTSRPSQDSARVEALLIDHLQVQPRQMTLVVFEMVRDAQGCLRDLKPLGKGGGAYPQAESPLLEAFVQGFACGRRKRARP